MFLDHDPSWVQIKLGSPCTTYPGYPPFKVGEYSDQHWPGVP
jgi:hypothetical protein